MKDLDAQFLDTYSFKNWHKIGPFGLYVPNYINYSNRMENVIAYLTFSEIFPHENNSIAIIKKIYSSYFNKDVIQWISKLNYVLSIKYQGKTDDFPLANTILESAKPVGLIRWRRRRKFVSRQQLLSNLKFAMLFSSNEMKKFANSDLAESGKLLFRITDFLESKLVNVNDPQVTKAIMARNLLFNSTFNFSMAVSRYSYIFNNIYLNNSSKNFAKIFKDNFKVEFDFYLWVGFAVWGLYDENHYRLRLSEPHEYIFSGNYFKLTNSYTKQNYKKVINLISNTLTGFKKDLKKEEKTNGELYSFQAFFRSPLFRDRDKYYLLDKYYLEQRITEGAFWQILDKTKQSHQKQELKGDWGKVFEIYAHDLIKSVYKDGQRIVSEIGENKQYTYGVDVLIYYPDTLVSVEITTRKIPYNIWIEANPEKTKKYIEELLIHKDGRGKAKQLYDLWVKVKSNTADLSSITNKSKIKRIIPIIVFEDAPPVHAGMWSIYEEVLVAAGYEKEFIDNLIFWSIQDLESAMGLVEQGTTLINLIDSLQRNGYLRDTINNYLHYEKKNLIYPKFCRSNFDKWGENVDFLFK